MTNNKTGILRLLELAKEKRGKIILSSIFSALASICALVPYMASYLIICEFIMYYGSFDAVDRDYIILLGSCALLGIIMSMILNGVAFTLSHFAAYAVLFNIRLSLSRHISKLPLGYFDSTNKGEISKSMQENVEFIENFIAHKIPDFIQTITSALAIFIMFIIIDWRLGLMCVAIYVIAMIVQFSVYGKTGATNSVKEFFNSLERINSSSMEFVRGILVVKMFSKSIQSFQNFAMNVNAYRDYTLDFCNKCMPAYNIFLILVNSFILFVLPLASIIILENASDIVFALTLLCVIIFSNALIAPLLRISTLSRSIMQINEGVQRIDKIFNAKTLPQSSNPIEPKNFSIEFRNVSFAYKSLCNSESALQEKNKLHLKHDSKPCNCESTPYCHSEHSEESIQSINALHNISFSLNEGESLAIIGKSGSGKSTILSLLARFYDVSSGEILIGGVDIKDMSEENLMNSLSMVFQDSFLFLDSIRENIRAGSFNATQKDILEAASLAQCDDIISKFGLDSIIGQNNVFISGGEAQRINIARAFVKNSPILLLDEITSNLDSVNERKINSALASLKKDKTTIMISHKLGSIINADKILLLDKGKLIALGTHKELMEKSPEYREFYELYKDTAKWQLRN